MTKPPHSLIHPFAHMTLDKEVSITATQPVARARDEVAIKAIWRRVHGSGASDRNPRSAHLVPLALAERIC